MGACARFLPETGEQKAHRLLKRVRKRTHSRLGVLYAKIDKGYPDDHRQMSMVANILHQAADTDYFRENVFRSREWDNLPQNPELEVAGKVLQEFADKHGASWAVSLDWASFGFRKDMEEQPTKISPIPAL